MSDQFKAYKTMNEATRQQLLKDAVDCITPALKEEQDFLAGRSCPKCGSGHCQPVIDNANPFGGPGILPKKLLLCHNCQVMFEPYTGIQLNMGRVPINDQKISQMFMDKFAEFTRGEKK